MADIEALRCELQEKLGNSPEVKISQFKNWSRLQKINHLLTVTPENLEEIQKTVIAAKSMGLKVRCAGAGYSWSELFPDENNVLMDMKKLNDIYPVPNENMTQVRSVRLQSGATLGDLMKFEKKNGFCFPCNVIVPTPTWGGVISTGSHGVGNNCMTVCDYVIDMSIVNSDGELIKYSKAEDPDMFKAVKCSLGLFGIIYEIHIEVYPQKTPTVVNDFETTVGEIFYKRENLKKLVTENESVEIFWFPFQGQGIFLPFNWFSKKWEPKDDKTWIRTVNTKEARMVEKRSLDSDRSFDPFPLGINMPKFTYEACRWAFQDDEPETMTEAIHYLKWWMYRFEKVHDMEWCFEVTNDFDTITKACQIVIELVKKKADAGEFPMTMAMEMRWMAHSDAYLSPAGLARSRDTPCIDSPHTVYLEVLTPTFSDDGWEQFCNEVYMEWTNIADENQLPITKPRVHWGKEWGFLEGINDYIRENYPEMPRFLEKLEESGADPCKMFTNERLKKIFFPENKVSTKKQAVRK